MCKEEQEGRGLSKHTNPQIPYRISISLSKQSRQFVFHSLWEAGRGRGRGRWRYGSVFMVESARWNENSKSISSENK